MRSLRIVVVFFALLGLAGCGMTGNGLPQLMAGPTSSAQRDAGAAYCTQSGGTVETRYPYYDTSSANPLRLSGSGQFCVFTAADQSRIFISVDTLYTDQPSLAAIAYRARLPIQGGGAPSANPSSLYCTQLGGTDLFGGVGAATGAWAKEGATDAIAMCVFPDLSIIDSWGLTYHSDGTIRGADLTELLRYNPEAK